MPDDSQKTKAETIKALWESLVDPSWDYGNLVEFGKLIYARTALKDIPKAKFDPLLPFLVQIAEGLTTRLDVAAKKTPEQLDADAPSRSPKEET